MITPSGCVFFAVYDKTTAIQLGLNRNIYTHSVSVVRASTARLGRCVCAASSPLKNWQINSPLVGSVCRTLP